MRPPPYGARARRAGALLLLVGAILATPATPSLAQATAGTGDPLRSGAIPGLDAYVEGAMASWDAPGLALVLVRGDSVFTRAYGVTAAGGDPVDEHTLFAIGSLTKAFTATLLAMLVDEGEVFWDDPVIRHLPDFELHDPYVTRHLTLRDALSHRTGLPRGDLIWAGGGVGPWEVIRRLRFLEFASGFRAGFSYSNEMYLLAGELAAKVAGRPWGELVRARILEPLGMERSTTDLGQLRDRTNVALPHDEIGPGQFLGTAPSAKLPPGGPTEIRRIEWSEPITVPAGGIASSATEFGRWLRLQLGAGEVEGERLVSEEALMATRTPQVPIPGFPGNQSEASETNLNASGMGWGVRDYRGRLMLTHTGSTQGWSAAVALLPAERSGVAVFVNITRGASLAGAVVRWILDRLLGAEPKDWNEEALARAEQRRRAEAAAKEKAAAARIAGTKPPLPLEGYAGTYVDSLHPPALVTFREGKLRFVLGPVLGGDLDHWQDDTFRVTWDREDFGANFVTFHVGDGEHPDSVESRILGQNAVWHRTDAPLSEESERALRAGGSSFQELRTP